MTNQPTGPALPNFKPPPAPARTPLLGNYAHLVPTHPDAHAAKLFDAFARSDASFWTYLPYGPFASASDYQQWMQSYCTTADPLFFTILNAQTQTPLGLASYLRITPQHAVLEIGHLAFSLALQKTPAATETIFLLLDHAFALGYRRVEWKCDNLNAPSKSAALRLGFTPEGVFRQHIIYKNRNRDTAWFAILDKDWPRLRTAHTQWLAPANFTPDGTQRTRLSDLTGARASSV